MFIKFLPGLILWKLYSLGGILYEITSYDKNNSFIKWVPDDIRRLQLCCQILETKIRQNEISFPRKEI